MTGELGIPMGPQVARTGLDPEPRIFREVAEWLREAGRGHAADVLEAALDELREALEAVRIEAMNGAICSPPETGDEFFGQPPNPDGKINLFDVDAMTCKPCQAMWRKVLAALDVLSRIGAG